MFRNQENFAVRIYAALQERTAEAIRQVNQLPEAVIRGPSVAGEIEKIVTRFTVQVPELRPDEKKGKRRVEEGRGDDYVCSFERTLFDVTIPTTGDA